MKREETQLAIDHLDEKLTTLLTNIDALVDRKLRPVAEDIRFIKQDIEAIKQTTKATTQALQLLKTEVDKLRAA